MNIRMLPPMPHKRVQSSKNIADRQPLKQIQQERPFLQNKKIKLESKFTFVRTVSAKSVKSSKSSLSERSLTRASSRLKQNYLVKKYDVSQKEKLRLPTITSRSWGVFEMKQQKMIYGEKTTKRRQLASLTKIMNLVTILELLKDEKLQPEKIKIKVTPQASKIIGTTAELKEGEVYSLYDLFYGMMLPSGNDAAYLIAQLGGLILHIAENGLKKSILYEKILDKQLKKGSNFVIKYLYKMNKVAQQIGLKCSKWSNPHGLSNRQNFTNIEDMGLLCMFAMKNSQFREIVNKKQYSCYVFSTIEDKENVQPNEEHISKIVKWENTNKMLDQGWNGIKTGITPNAGPCLSASVMRKIEGKVYEFLVLLGNCDSMQQRWKQVDEIVSWVIENRLY